MKNKSGVKTAHNLHRIIFLELFQKNTKEKAVVEIQL